MCGKFFTTFRLPMNIGYLLLYAIRPFYFSLGNISNARHFLPIRCSLLMSLLMSLKGTSKEDFYNYLCDALEILAEM